MTIPASAISFDGNHAWWVLGNDIWRKVNEIKDGEIVSLDRPCDMCHGTKVGPNLKTCTICDGTGRHCFKIEAWLCDVYDCAKCIGGGHKRRDTFRVHAIDVRRIRDNETDFDPPYDSGDFFICADGCIYLDTSADYMKDITLPPDAEPGMFAVRLAVHAPENVEEPT